MKIYTVHRKFDAKEEDEFQLVPEDFSWWGFFFPLNIIWALNNRCWLFFVICTAIFALYIINYIEPFEHYTLINMTKIPVQLALGIFAYDFKRWSLRAQGYEFIGVVSGAKENEALRNFLVRQ